MTKETMSAQHTPGPVPEKLSLNQWAVLIACTSGKDACGHVPRSSSYPTVLRALEKRGLIRTWEPAGWYHGEPQVEITEIGRAAIAKATGKTK